MTWKQAAQKAQQSKVKPIPDGWSTKAMIAKSIGVSGPDSASVTRLLHKLKPERKQWTTIDNAGMVRQCFIYRNP